MKRISLIFFASLISAGISLASPVDSIQNPKIGLVLSGGAAKGMAHIGVLKVLEQVGIKPDYITGTSMGAVVGGLYAMGYSAEEIEQMAVTADWDFLLSDHMSLDKIAFEEKYEYDRFIFGVPIRDGKFRLPSGVIEGQQLEKLFAELMWPLDENVDFDSLSVPFSCVGVDLISGRIIEFHKGNLAESIRASMSIPSIFSPESIDSLLLVDGGTHRNFPVEEVKRMGADIVIGVYAGFEENVSKEDMFSLSDVVSRSIVLSGIIDTRDQSEMVDIYIEPELEGLSASEFHKSRQFIYLGELAAIDKFDELRSLADSLSLSPSVISKMDVPHLIRITEMDVVNDRSFISDEFVIAKSGILKGQIVDREQLSTAIDNIYGTQYFKKVTYSLENRGNDNYRLIFKVKESTRAYLNFSAHYNNQYGPGLIANLNLRNSVSRNSRTSISLNLSENPELVVDVNKYFGRRQGFLKYAYLDISAYENYLYNGGIDLGTYRVNSFKTGTGFKYSILPNIQTGIVFSYERKVIEPNANLKNYFGTESFRKYTHSGISYKLFYRINTMDDSHFPTSGVKLDVSYSYSYNTSVSFDINTEDREVVNSVINFRDKKHDFDMLFMDMKKYFTIFDKLSFHVGVTAGISSEESAVVGNFVLGGVHNDRREHYIPFAGKKFAEDVVSNFGLISTGLDIEFLPGFYISGIFNSGIFSMDRDSFLYNIRNRNFDYQQKGYCLGIKTETILGPLSLMAGSNNIDKGLSWYINLGHSF